MTDKNRKTEETLRTVARWTIPPIVLGLGLWFCWPLSIFILSFLSFLIVVPLLMLWLTGEIEFTEKD